MSRSTSAPYDDVLSGLRRPADYRGSMEAVPSLSAPSRYSNAFHRPRRQVVGRVVRAMGTPLVRSGARQL